MSRMWIYIVSLTHLQCITIGTIWIFSRKFSQSFWMFSHVFSRFSRGFRSVRTCSDPFGSIRTHWDAFGRIRKHLEAFGRFRKILRFFRFLNVCRGFRKEFLQKKKSQRNITSPKAAQKNKRKDRASTRRTAERTGE